MLIGARNVVYNISLTDLSENVEQRIEWNSRHRDTELCLVKGKSEDDCNNYIRVLARQGDKSLLVCGTNSYSPRCRSYEMNEAGVYEVARERSGKGYTPYDPRNNSTFIFTGDFTFLHIHCIVSQRKDIDLYFIPGIDYATLGRVQSKQEKLIELNHAP